jgi:hypothetical protein
MKAAVASPDEVVIWILVEVKATTSIALFTAARHHRFIAVTDNDAVCECFRA